MSCALFLGLLMLHSMVVKQEEFSFTFAVLLALAIDIWDLKLLKALVFAVYGVLAVCTFVTFLHAA
jgi:hypothetical protein